MDNAYVVPCSSLDLTATPINLTFAFVFDARLDAEKLRRALFQAIETKLPRAGARLVKRSGSYEFHVPRRFDASTPPAGFTHTHHDAPYDRTLPIPIPPHVASEPCVFNRDERKARLFRSPETPGGLSLEDYLKPGRPMLHVHVTTYEDATLLGIEANHTLFDAFGLRDLLLVWTAALRNDTSIPFSPPDIQPFEELKATVAIPTPKKGEHPMRLIYSSETLGFWGTFLVIWGFIWMAIWDPKESTRMVYVPRAWLEEQKEACMDALEERGKEWVSSSDVLQAWLYKTLHAHRKDATPIHINTPINLRRLLPDILPPSLAYINNTTLGCSHTPIPAHKLGSQPILDTALTIRRDLNEWTSPSTRDTLRAEVAWFAQFKGTGKLLFFAPAGGEHLILSNWRSAELNGVDFSGALHEGKEVREVREVKPVYVSSYVQEGSRMPKRGTGTVCSETEDGLWLTVTRSERDWEGIRQSGAVRFV
ncbi:hypothetical protein EXIGLDRAFT_90943 [Exidia glandulosa HHB12029]|uniref:Uncharacterized protein n=1 Tax=Exidia glandulosa HHB12029 TaxID=1314781 RepID=A0A165HAH8_EXIGL|nr:hypothetical protein EXIGLDRAFT_90943 [Exidia glandulosa HHB12029]